MLINDIACYTCILVGKITTAQNEAALSYHYVRGLYILLVIFAATNIQKNIISINKNINKSIYSHELQAHVRNMNIGRERVTK